ncbi:MAG: hypothetical protein LBT10_03615 [Methanobrevibacter sp.]|jgi:hypothetical protein|nr:hypothetical protein [Methanobrevibacter sp.]
MSSNQQESPVFRQGEYQLNCIYNMHNTSYNGDIYNGVYVTSHYHLGGPDTFVI